MKPPTSEQRDTYGPVPETANTGKPGPNAPAFLTPDEFAARLRVHRGTVYSWVRDGLPVLRVGRRVRVRVFEAEIWIERRSAAPAVVVRTTEVLQ